MLRKLFLLLLVIGGLNWGLYGLFTFDLVAWICGGSHTLFARVIYTLVGVSAVAYPLLMLARPTDTAPDHA